MMLAENELPLFESTAAATEIYIYSSHILSVATMLSNL